ncbi:MAG: patatin-like phospholipase family protein [Balneolales bacterium]
MKLYFLVAFGLLTLLNPDALVAQSEESRVGLVLSGGGAKGFAHIGVMKVLEEVDMPIDIITGTSMGAVIGGLYSIGYTAEEMEAIAIQTNWQSLFRDDIRRRHIPIEDKLWDGMFLVSLPLTDNGISLPSGLIFGHKTNLLFSRLTWPYHELDSFGELPIPFACIATDLETGEAVVLKSGDLAKAIQASSAIPSIFSPVELDGRKLVDGGLVRNLPVQDAIDMGATFTLAINSSTQLLDIERILGMTDVLTQTINLQMMVNMKGEEDKSDFLLNPDLQGYNMLDFGDVQRIIRFGEDTARENIDRLREIADSLNANRNSQKKVSRVNTNSIYLNGVSFTNLQQLSDEQALAQMNLSSTGRVTLDEIEEGIARLYGLQLFNKVSYKMIKQGNGYHMVVDAQENLRDLIRFGFRYDSWTRASLLLNTTFRNVITRNSVLRLNSRFGEQLELDLHYFNYFGYKPKLAAGLDIKFTRYSLDYYEENVRTANVNTDALAGEFFLGSMFSSLAMGGVGLRQEIFNPSTRIGPDRFVEGWSNFTSLFGRIWLESYDNSVFPSQGNSINIHSEFSLPQIASVSFSRHEFSLGSYYPLSPKWVFQNRIYGGHTFGPDLPFHHQLFLGGYPDFPGYRLNELTGQSVASIRGSLRYEVVRNRYLMIGANAGNTYDRFTFSLDGIKVGWDVTAATNSILGPVSITIMGSDLHPVLLEFNAGYRF